MDRRSMLVLCGGLATSLAGCSESTDDAEGTTRSPTETGATSPRTGDTTPLSIRSTTAPGSVEIGQPYTIQFTVENPTDEERTLDTPVSVRTENGWRSFTSISAEVPPGTTKLPFEFTAPRFLGTYRFRIGNPTAEWQIETTERRLVYGESFTTPQGLTLSVRGGRFADSYSPRENRTVTPTSDHQFLVIQVRVSNPTDGPIALPPFAVFHVRANDTRHDVALDNPSQRLTLDPGNHTQIELPFLVSTTVSAADLEVQWTPEYQQGQTVVIWQAD